MARALCAWAINRRGKKSVRNLRYGPRTRLVEVWLVEVCIALRIPTAHDFRVISASTYTTTEISLKLSSIAKQMFLFFSTSTVTYICYHIIVVYILSSLIFKKNKINIIAQEKKISWNRAKNCYSGKQIMTAKTTTIRTLYVHVVLNDVIFRQISYDTVPHALHFLPAKFSLSIT